MLRKILAVDDSALIHQMYKLFLSRYKNCKLVSAMNGLEALDKLGQEEEIDLILLDVVLPGMGGDEFYRILREKLKSSIPVIVCSVDDRMLQRVREVAPVQGVFTKGTQGDDLRKMIVETLGGAGDSPLVD